MSDDLEPDEGSYALVMPFVVCDDQGGPYQADAFLAGCRYESIRHRLDSRPYELREYVEPALVPQLDLLAMHMEYNFEAKPWDEHPDEWMLARFTLEPLNEPEETL